MVAFLDIELKRYLKSYILTLKLATVEKAAFLGIEL